MIPGTTSHPRDCCLWLALLAMCFGSALFDSMQAAEHPRVLVDRSHQWLFAYDDLAERMLQPAGFEVVLCDASLDTKVKLKDFDIVFIQQTNPPFPFSPGESRLLLDYVRGGGRLILVGNPTCPIAGVARQFGFALKLYDCKHPLRSADWLCREFGAEPVLQTQQMHCRLEGSTNTKPLIIDQAGAVIAAGGKFGEGAVVCFADDIAYWDFCGQRDANMRVPNVPTTVSLFKCLLTDEKQPSSEGPPAVRITAELEIELPGLLVRYSNPVSEWARKLLAPLPRVSDLVAKANGGPPPAEQFTVNILAGGGGGWSGGREIGIPCSGSPGSDIAVIAHELTHSWEGPMPAVVAEGWASMVGMRVTRALGYHAVADEERRSWQERFVKAESRGGKLDITLADTPGADREFALACEGKMMWLIEQMETHYGRDFMPRFLEISHALKGRQQRLTIHEVLYFFSLAAGEDLTPDYQKLGIGYKPPQVVSPEELKRRIEEFRRSK